MKAYGGIDMQINLGNSWRWVVSFTLRPLSPPGKEAPVSIRKEAG
jgi:hypothetical protein